jgi:orotidine-5'-phosphate decarboxylase
VLIEQEKSIIPSLDVDFRKAVEIMTALSDHPAVGAFKVGFSLILRLGLNRIMDAARSLTSKPIIYDHQKAGTDIPATGPIFAQACSEAVVDAVILFPLAGPVTMNAWIEACHAKKLTVIVGGMMTHPEFLKSEGGYIDDEAPKRILSSAWEHRISHFVVPGNKPDFIKEFRSWFRGPAVLFAPGLISQDGRITEAGKVAGPEWHAIVGRAIYNAKDYRAVVTELAREII